MSAPSLPSSPSLIPTAADLEGFRAAQRLAYACAEAIHAELRPGITEREVAAKMKTWLADHGATDCLHQPFAWFGNRTAFRGLIGVNQLRGFNPAFFPSNKKLEENMPFILDCAPTLNGYTADIGYAGVLGHNPILDQLMDDLAAHRELIIRMIRERRLMSEVSQAVDSLCIKQGVEPRHHAYPFAVLAHRVEKLPDAPIAPKISLGRFGIRSVLSLGREAVQGVKEGWSPLWASHQRSAHAPVPGLWAVEPHLGFRHVGAKFEELLVITEDDAFWLDDDVPHVQRWIERGVIAAPATKAVKEKVSAVAVAPKVEAAATVSKKEVVNADAKLAVKKAIAPKKVATAKAVAEKKDSKKAEKPKSAAKPEKAKAPAKAEEPKKVAAKVTNKKSNTRKTETA
ncbi:MAG: M24 family metallopeptidase [Pedobacter sp.]|nr:M24 family metallopeptidase [Pedobacter sp.]